MNCSSGQDPATRGAQLAGVRGFYGYTMAHPARSESFMGVELHGEGVELRRRAGLGPC